MLMQAIQSVIIRTTATIHARAGAAADKILATLNQAPGSTLMQLVHRGFIGLHRDERGDNENLGRLLILALVLVPLIILITIFGDAIYAEAQAQWDAVMGSGVG